jgi:hypothetical protein
MKSKDSNILTNFSNDTGQDDLLLAGSLDGLAEIGVVPSVNLTLTADEGCSWVHVEYLLWKGAVWTLGFQISPDAYFVIDWVVVVFSP